MPAISACGACDDQAYCTDHARHTVMTASSKIRRPIVLWSRKRDAELVGVLGELRVAQPDRERPAHGLALAGDLVVDALLLGRERFDVERRDAGHSLLRTV